MFILFWVMMPFCELYTALIDLESKNVLQLNWNIFGRTESPSSRHVNSTMKPQAKSPARQPDQEDISQLSPIIR